MAECCLYWYLASKRPAKLGRKVGVGLETVKVHCQRWRAGESRIILQTDSDECFGDFPKIAESGTFQEKIDKFRGFFVSPSIQLLDKDKIP